ncbi:dihydroxyacetone kinase subunit DhaK [Olivibacter sp. SDN3]|uniref:dihydroxyacetone kinase subunit DhaK n=1 Tax=Olivibacter sp. SDN3 TaxID=2764720 RepID=UPI0016518A8A|nr:dihydroxyacetone kinase subunit DhaK [Olivibacter sp. SDN3]QNL48270.1 dihydroxyacetone kinase subunit DhaK [Olivibacter sp. SDN3]
MKAFINDTDQVVNDSLLGVATNPDVQLLDTFPKVRVVVRRDWKKNKVAVISGGGSGHEPAHAGFVGKGMLTAAVCGDIFASPSVDAVLSAILSVTGKKGCLLIIKNYTGDRLNFGLAAEQARALGLRVETITVGDDIALGKEVQRRGLAGTVFVQKVAGQLAEEGKSLDKIVDSAQKVVNHTVSIGLSLTDSRHFDQEEPTRLKSEEAEIGLGIHGEPGAEIISYEQADKLVAKAVQKLRASLPKTKAKYALLLNNMGSVSPIEMNILIHAFAKTRLAKQVSYLVGPAPIMSSINMSGFSLSLVLLNDEIERTLLKRVGPSSWHISRFTTPGKIKSPKLPEIIPYKSSSNKAVKQLLEKISSLLISLEKEMNALDNKVGDGDAGTTFAHAGRKIKSVLNKLPLNDNSKLLLSIGRLLAREAGGSSGVLLSILFTAAGNAFPDKKELGGALMVGLEKMKELGGADLGDRTMIDALQPAFEAMEADKSLGEIAEAARKGAEDTKKITKTKSGRSSYLSARNLKDIPDPGAEIVARILEELKK